MDTPYLRLNPCGVEGEPPTHCKYVRECTDLGRQGSFICLSQMGYQVAKYLLEGSNTETERRHMDSHLSSDRSLSVVDPRLSLWEPKKLASLEFKTIVDEIISRGEEMAGQSSPLTIPRPRIRHDPLDFHCPVDDIVADLF